MPKVLDLGQSKKTPSIWDADFLDGFELLFLLVICLWVHGPVGVSTSSQCFLDVCSLGFFVFFFSNYCVDSVLECAEYSCLLAEVVAGVPVQVLVSVCGFPVDAEFCATILFSVYQGVQKRDFPLFFLFRSEFNSRVLFVQICHEVADVVLLEFGECVVDISQPEVWWGSEHG